jgi:hypothetical protein
LVLPYFAFADGKGGGGMPVTLARPDLKAHEESVRGNLPDIVAELAGLIGKKLTAYVGGAKDVADVECWIAGTQPYPDAEPRLRAAYHVVRFLAEYDEPAVFRLGSWASTHNSSIKAR